MHMLGCEVDARVGGDYRISYRTPDGEVVYVVGTYLDADPGERLVFTWTLEGTDREETLVTVEFRDRGWTP